MMSIFFAKSVTQDMPRTRSIIYAAVADLGPDVVTGCLPQSQAEECKEKSAGQALVVYQGTRLNVYIVTLFVKNNCGDLQKKVNCLSGYKSPFDWLEEGERTPTVSNEV